MTGDHRGIGRRERNKQDKRERIMAAARELFAEHGVGSVTTQHVADRADVAIGTLFRYASTKAELLIMVQNEKFADAITEGLSDAGQEHGVLDGAMALIRPVVGCVRGQVENGRTYLHELVFGDPTEPHRREGLTQSARLEDGITAVLQRDDRINDRDAAVLARVVTAIIHISTTATLFIDRSDDDVLTDIREQIHVALSLRGSNA
jgi:AcrR family transcriptional regulator